MLAAFLLAAAGLALTPPARAEKGPSPSPAEQTCVIGGLGDWALTPTLYAIRSTRAFIEEYKALPPDQLKPAPEEPAYAKARGRVAKALEKMSFTIKRKAKKTAPDGSPLYEDQQLYGLSCAHVACTGRIELMVYHWPNGGKTLMRGERLDFSPDREAPPVRTELAAADAVAFEKTGLPVVLGELQDLRAKGWICTESDWRQARAKWQAQRMREGKR